MLNLAIKHAVLDESVAVRFMVPDALLEAWVMWRNEKYAQLVRDLGSPKFYYQII